MDLGNKDVLHFIKKDKEIDAFYKSFFNLYNDIGKKVDNEDYQKAFLMITIITFFKYAGIPKEEQLKVIEQLKINVQKDRI